MAEPIKPVTGGIVNKFIQKLDKKIPDTNPSIFMTPQENEESRINDDFIFKQLYT